LCSRNIKVYYFTLCFRIQNMCLVYSSHVRECNIERKHLWNIPERPSILYTLGNFFVHKYSSHVPNPITFYSYNMAKQRKVILSEVLARQGLKKTFGSSLLLHTEFRRCTNALWESLARSILLVNSFYVSKMILAAFELTTGDITI